MAQLVLQRGKRSTRDQENLQRIMMFWVWRTSKGLMDQKVIYETSAMYQALCLRLGHTNARQMPSLPSNDWQSNSRQGMQGSSQIPAVICGESTALIPMGMICLCHSHSFSSNQLLPIKYFSRIKGIADRSLRKQYYHLNLKPRPFQVGENE